MDLRIKHRLAGAAVLLAVAVIVLPLLLDGQPRETDQDSLQAPPNLPGLGPAAKRSSEAPRPLAAARRPEARPVKPLSQQGHLPTTPPRVGRTGEPPKAWSLQVASFNRAVNARRLRDKLRKKGYVVYMEKRGAVYRVRIGPELELAAIKRIQREVRRAYGLKGLVMRYP